MEQTERRPHEQPTAPVNLTCKILKFSAPQRTGKGPLLGRIGRHGGAALRQQFHFGSTMPRSCPSSRSYHQQCPCHNLVEPLSTCVQRLNLREGSANSRGDQTNSQDVYTAVFSLCWARRRPKHHSMVRHTRNRLSEPRFSARCSCGHSLTKKYAYPALNLDCRSVNTVGE